MPIETSEFHQICANFDRIWHKHAGLRPACEHRANTCETCEYPCEQKTLKKQIVRKSCENVRAKKQPGKNRSCEHRANSANMYPNSTSGRNFTKKSPILPLNLLIHIYDRKLHGSAQKTLTFLFSDRKPPEFALKSAYWIF